MNGKTRELISLLEKNCTRLQGIADSMESVYADDLPKIGKTNTSALMVAGLIENYYTCIETMLFRINQYFGSGLDASRWHRDLLETMNVSVEESGLQRYLMKTIPGCMNCSGFADIILRWIMPGTGLNTSGKR